VALSLGAAPAVAAPVPSPLTQEQHVAGLLPHNVGPDPYGANTTAPGPHRGGMPSKAFSLSQPGTSIASALTAPLSGATPTGATSSPTSASPLTGSFPQVGGEIASFRTTYSNTFAAEGGGYIARIYTQPVNYAASDGSMQPIDDTLVATAGGFTNKADSSHVVLPAQIQTAPVSISGPRGSVSFQLLGAASAAPVISGALGTYTGVFPGVSLKYQTAPGVLKEAIELSSADDAPSVIRFALSLSDGLSPALDSAGNLEVTDAAGKAVYRLPAASMTDATKQNVFAPPTPGDVAVALTKSTDGGWILALTPDRSYLTAPGRQFPVVIDPTVLSLAGSDCELVSGVDANNSYCSYNLTSAGTTGTPAVRVVTSMQLPISGSIPADADVLSAQMNVDVYGKSLPAAMTISAYQLTHSFTASATWNKYDGVHTWSTPGGEYNATPLSSVNIPASGYQAFPMSALVQSWVNGTTPDDGIVLAADPSTTNYAAFYGTGPVSAGPSGDPDPPYLSVLYVPQLGTPRGATINQVSLSDTMSLGVNVANGNLLLHNTDLQISSTGLDQVIDRTYNNLSPINVDFGHGWASSAGRTPVLNGYPDGLVYYGSDGSLQLFANLPGNAYATPPGIDATLCSIYTTAGAGGCVGMPTGATYQLVFRDKVREGFDADGDLISTTDQNLNHQSYAYTGLAGALTTDTDTDGRTLTITPSGSTIPYQTSKIVDNAYTGGRQTQYFYTGTNLTSYVDPNGQTTVYGYDPSTGNLNKITDPDGNVTNLGYDTDGSGRIASISRVTNVPVLGAADTTTYAYVPPGTAFPGHPGGCPSDMSTPPAPAFNQTVMTDAKGNVTHYCSDTHDRVFFVQDSRGFTRENMFSNDDNVVEFQDSDSTPALFASDYDSNDRACATAEPTSGTHLPATNHLYYGSLPTVSAPDPCFTHGATTANAGHPYYPDFALDAQGNTDTLGYDPAGNLTGITVPAGSGSGVQMNYNSNGTLNWSRDGFSNQTNYTYYGIGDPSGNPGDLKTVTPPAPLGAVTYTYDTDSRIHTMLDGKGQTTTYHYDKMDRLIEADYQDGSSIVYTPDSDGNVVKIVDSLNGTSTYIFDAKNRLHSQALAPGQNTTYTYDANDNLLTLTDLSGVTTYGYDGDNDNTSVTEPGTSTPITIAYDANDRPNCVTYLNGVVVQSTYQGGGELTDTTALKPGNTCATTPSAANQLADYAYSYYSATTNTDTELRQSMTTLGGVTTAYGYDGRNRLVSASAPGNVRSYFVDGAGNVTKRVINSVTTSMAYNAANELCWTVTAASTNACGAPPTGASTYTFDADGNETGNSAGLGLTYDARNETTGITAGGTPTSLTYLGGQQLLTAIGATSILNNELGTAGQTTAGQTTYDTRDVDGALLDERTASGTYSFIQDGLGSIVGVMSPTGTVLDSAAYDPYGQITAATGTTPNPFTYASGLTTPGGLVKFGARYYDPALGRWTQTDPLAGPGDNLYLYVGGDPVDITDPSGLCFVVSCNVYHAAGKIVSGAANGAKEGAEEGFISGLAAGDPIAGAIGGAATGALAGGVTAAADQALPGSGEYVDVAFKLHDAYNDLSDLHSSLSEPGDK
jgi:RHS repeat-associated protein